MNAVGQAWLRLWAAASAPKQFFRTLEATPTRIARGGWVAFVSLSVLALACTSGFARATASDAWLPLAFFALCAAILLFLYVWVFGSLFVQRPGALDVRAWEVTGWSWAPAFFGGISMLVPLLVLPLLALPLTLFGVLVWHLISLRTGLAVFLERPAYRVLTLYALFIYLLPLLLLVFVSWLSSLSMS